MSTLTLFGYFGQIKNNDVEKYKFDLMECMYNYVVIHNINYPNLNIIKLLLKKKEFLKHAYITHVCGKY